MDRKPYNILISEDEPDIALALQLALEGAGYNASVVLDSEKIFKIIPKQSFSLALVDIRQPGIDGVELLKYISKTSPSIPVVMMSVHGSEELAVECMKIGATDYISKPFVLDDMLQRVDSAIGYSLALNKKKIEEEIVQEMYRQTIEELDALKIKMASHEINDENSVVKSIEFDEDTCQAGISILSYFSTIVSQKYPDTKVKVRIEQEGLKVRLVVETPTGEKENIEKTLEDYGLVVVGQMQPEELLTVPIQVMQLRHKLDMAVMEVSHTKELLYAERSSYGRQIDGLNKEVAHLKIQISEAFKREDHSRDILTKIIDKYKLDESAREAILKLSAYIECGVGEKDKDIVLELLSIIKKQDTSAFDDVKSYMTASLGGATGNLLSSWLPMVVAIIQKM